MAYKKLGCCAADLEEAAAHCGDSDAHITPEERETWNANTAEIETLACEGVTLTANSAYISGWNALHNFRAGGALHINGNFKIISDIPGGTTLFTLPQSVKWAYVMVQHGDNVFFAIANGTTVYLPNSIEMLKSTAAHATIVGFARITAQAASTEV